MFYIRSVALLKPFLCNGLSLDSFSGMRMRWFQHCLLKDRPFSIELPLILRQRWLARSVWTYSGVSPCAFCSLASTALSWPSQLFLESLEVESAQFFVFFPASVVRGFQNLPVNMHGVPRWVLTGILSDLRRLLCRPTGMPGNDGVS